MGKVTIIVESEENKTDLLAELLQTLMSWENTINSYAVEEYDAVEDIKVYIVPADD